jgi:hypothetical protein
MQPENPSTHKPAAPTGQPAKPAEPKKPSPPEEIGGSDKPEPTRYGDWEIGGKCVDF